MGFGQESCSGGASASADSSGLGLTDTWVWDGNDKIILVGDACAKLKSGQVKDVQVVTGCPTEIPK